MELGRRLRSDLARPEAPTSRDEVWFHVLAPLVILAIAQLTDPGSLGEVLLLVPAVLAFVARVVVPRLPAELFAVLVVVPTAAAIGNRGNLEGAFFLSVVMVLYTSWTLRSLTRCVAVAVVAGAAPWFVSAHLVPEADITWYPWAAAHLFTSLLGRTLQHQHDLIEQLEEARSALAAQAVAEERRRIARELHDLAGHTLAAVLLHVTGARHVLRRDPAEAEAALRDAEAVGRGALDQIRAVVSGLRADERGTDQPLAGGAQLPALLADYRRAGLSVEADLAPEAAAIDGPVGTALHRIAGEALANVARHNPTNHVAVTLAVASDGVHLSVVDQGRPPGPASGDGRHFGLVGMRERARAVGGEVSAGPTTDGWRVEARLPLPGTAVYPVVPPTQPRPQAQPGSGGGR